MLNLMPYLSLLGAAIAWLHIVFMGRTSGGIHNVITVGNAYTLRAIAYFLLVTETLPPVSDQEPAANVPAGRPASKALAKAAATKPRTTERRRPPRDPGRGQEAGGQEEPQREAST